MSPVTHIAFTYILIFVIEKVFGVSFSLIEILIILGLSNIMDLDYIFARITGKTGQLHHDFFTHTPLGLLIFWIISSIILLFFVQPLVILALLLGLLGHLFLDEFQYILYKIKLQPSTPYKQINWLYPFTKPSVKSTKTLTLYDIKSDYKYSVISELIIICISISIFFINSLDIVLY